MKWAYPEVKCLRPTSSRRGMCTASVSNLIYRKVSYGAASYKLSKKVNMKLEFVICLPTTFVKVVIITDLGQRQKSALNAENTTDHPKTLQVPSSCCFS